MADIKLVFGNKKYSSWSLRPWLLLRHFGIEFEEIRIALNMQQTPQRVREFSPTGKVPVLVHQGITVWDSLAICEYVSEELLGGRGWPRELKAKYRARSISCEMHSGFGALRSQWPMNVALQRKMPRNAELDKDIARVEGIWNECLQSGGPWLFGEFSIADAMFAPVALRFYSYQPELSEGASMYVKTMLAHPAIKEWMAAGAAEQEVIKEDEVSFLLGEPGWV
ncbi:MAG: glutathione S-transferase family protein [Pseudomonadota bacterium]